MAKYLILYKSERSAKDLMENSTAEEKKASMGEWMAWKEALPEAIGFEWGLPLQPAVELTTSGVQDSQSTVSGHATMEGDKDEIVEVLRSHPHLKRDGASIDVLEMISMPGM